ncbi:MAG: restriction endonuclease subunit S, partial [Clostridia bacterium]
LLDKQIELWETKLKLNEQKERYYQNLFLYNTNLFPLNMVKIMDIFDIKRGNVLNTRNVSTDKDSFFKYPVYSSQTLHNGLMGYYNEYLFEKCIT